MNMRRFLFLALVAAGLTMVGLAGCERKILGPERVIKWPPPPPPEPIAAVSISVSAPSGKSPSELDGVIVRLWSGETKVAEQTLSGVTASPYIVTFDTSNVTYPSLLIANATYRISMRRSLATVQSTFITLNSTAIQTVAFILKIVETGTNTTVESKPVSATEVTTVEVAQPPSVTTSVPTAAKATIEIPAGSGITGEVKVAQQTPSQVPPVVESGTNTVKTGIVSAIEISLPAGQSTSAPVPVKIPLPIPQDKWAQAAGTGGQTMDVFKYDLTLDKWEKVGTGTIGADGTVDYTFTQGIGENTLVSIGNTPKVAQSVTTIADPTPALSPTEVEKRKQAGDPDITITQPAPSVVIASTRPASPALLRPAAIDAPTGVDANNWSYAVNHLIANVDDAFLRNWLQTGQVTQVIPLNPTGVTQQVEKQTHVRRFSFDVPYGAYTYTFTLTITYVKGELVDVTHTSAIAGT